MPPVEFGKPGTSKEVEFIANVSHDGTDYGPDYPEKIATLPAYIAHQYVAQGRAIATPQDPPWPAEGGGGECKQQDPKDPPAAKSGAKK